MAPNLVLSAAVQLSPFQGPNGQPMLDVSEFAKVLDYIGSLFLALPLSHFYLMVSPEIMNYDAWGSFSPSVGPNAPLNDSCAPPADQKGSAVSAVQAWSKAGFPKSQIILGVPSYGHSFRVNRCEALDASGTLKLYPAFNKNDQPAGDKWDGTASGVDICGNANVVGGIFDFWGLIDAGFLGPNGTVVPGIHQTYDNCSKTVRVLNTLRNLANSLMTIQI
jgi:chitinase